MGGKSRKSGGVSKALINKIKNQFPQTGKKTDDGKPKKDDGFNLRRSDEGD
jgi:hypothetical protein